MIGGLPVAKATELTYDVEALSLGKYVLVSKEIFDLVKTRCEATHLKSCVVIEQLNHQLTTPQNVIERKKARSNWRADNAPRILR